jgi:FlaA1/EpsC-like NDP-sugar epimerase
LKVLITGATGTLGRKVINKLLERGGIEILGISRDEQKQRTMPKHSNLTMRLADIRFLDSLDSAVRTTYDVVGHFAALKCVDTLEDNPMEAILTNINGTRNVMQLTSLYPQGKLVLASTDKAVFPINTYGHTKALAEKITLQDPNNVVCRYGNVLGSRGSVVPAFIRSLKDHNCIEITDPAMTRFWLTTDQAADFVIRHMLERTSYGLAIPNIKAAKVVDVGRMIGKILGVRDFNIKTIGIRPGEKLHECLEPGVESHTCDQLTENELHDLLYPLVVSELGKLN